MRYQILILCISSIILLETTEARRVYDEDHQALIRKIRSYTKRQVDGTCLYEMCNQTSDYPSEEILKVMQKRDEYKEFFGTVMAPYNTFIKSRFGGEENMCQSVPVFMLPQKARDVNGVWQTVVNVGEEFQQIVHFEACAEGAECYAQAHLPGGHQTTCAVEEIVFRMIVLGPDGDLKMAPFRIPAGCYCKYIFNRRNLV
ncbi:hypothetical protein AMK59_6350 [Oryctes borbonicus]|uniref:Spaetzle domain-containing protein n=1 Tax=Oryctes borbonicus TaxID=1629725 RepID=A0A0T6B2X7_9SCAR|nr:hypothetical protein AMK59_6350 [Oryctes borbonicus]